MLSFSPEEPIQPNKPDDCNASPHSIISQKRFSDESNKVR